MTLIFGLLIPLLGTMLGAAFVFLMKDEMPLRLQKRIKTNIDIYAKKDYEPHGNGLCADAIGTEYL